MSLLANQGLTAFHDGRQRHFLRPARNTWPVFCFCKYMRCKTNFERVVFSAQVPGETAGLCLEVMWPSFHQETGVRPVWVNENMLLNETQLFA